MSAQQPPQMPLRQFLDKPLEIPCPIEKDCNEKIQAGNLGELVVKSMKHWRNDHAKE